MPDAKEIDSVKRALVFAAHPDDEVLGCGGTVALLSKQGYEVDLIVFTDGCSARYVGDVYNEKLIEDKNKRMASLLKSCEVLGIKKCNALGLPDNALDSVPLLGIAGQIEKTIENTSYDIVLTHTDKCLNIDHKRVNEATKVVFRAQNNFANTKIMCYEVPSSTEWAGMSVRFNPNCWVDITDVFERKMTALVCYRSELRDSPHPRSVQLIQARLVTNGSEICAEYAERFEILREVIR